MIDIYICVCVCVFVGGWVGVYTQNFQKPTQIMFINLHMKLNFPSVHIKTFIYNVIFLTGSIITNC